MSLGLGLLAAAWVWEAIEAGFDGDIVMWLAPCEDTWMELGVGMTEQGAAVDTWCSLSWRAVRSVLVARENVFKVEPRSGVEQLSNALKHL